MLGRIKGFFRVFLITLKRKLRCFLRSKLGSLFKFIFRWIIIFLVISLILFVSIISHISSEVPISIASGIILVFLTYDILQFFFRLTLFMERRKYSKPYKRAKSVSLYRWSEGIELEERIFFRILSEKSKEDPVKNLVSIKEKVDTLCSNDVIQLQLLKAYVERRLSNNLFENVKSIFWGVLASIITASFNKTNLLEKFFQWLNNYFNGSTIQFNTSSISIIISYFIYFLIFFTLFMYASNILTRDKRRLKLIQQIIDISINEK